MGSSRPNLARRFARTSAGTLGLVASSSKGSPGASARIVKSRRLMPKRTGIRMRRRRSKYFDIAVRLAASRSLLGLLEPVLEVPEVGVPATLLDVQAVADRRHPRAEDDGDDDHLLDDHLVHLDEQGRPLDRVQLRLGRLVELVV